MKPCPSGKKVFATETLAEDALIEARANYHYPKDGGPIAVYKCEDCGYYHLTSRPPMNARLAKHIAEGKLGIEKLANDWLNRLKKK